MKMVKIGIFGKIFWSNTIINSEGDNWNYDISPEYIYHYREDIEIDSKEVVQVFNVQIIQ